MLNFKNNCTVGVAVTPDFGLEIAQIDYNSKKILKYGCRQLAYDNNRKEIADLDIFKETLQDLLTELDIPKGAEISLCLPTISFKVTDYPAALDDTQITVAIEEELGGVHIFQDNEPCISAVKLPNSTIQFKKIASTAMQKVTLIEIAMQIKELGYKLSKIDVSTNCTLNALIYNDRVNTAPDASWVLLMIDNNACRVISMMGANYVDCFEEKISIGEVLGEEENYATVLNTIAPILKGLPSQCLYIVSKTNVISAKELAKKVKYNAPIVHQESNIFNAEQFLPTADGVPADKVKTISLDVIGAALGNQIEKLVAANFNLYNESLGDIYTQEQPFSIVFGNRKIVMSLENMIPASIIFAIVITIATVIILIPLRQANAQKLDQINKLDQQINDITKFLEQNKNVSSDLFDEGDEINIGIGLNKNVYSYYTIVGTEIPRKLWLTELDLGQYTTIKGQSDNLESVYSFFRKIKEYNPESGIKLQRLGFSTNSKNKSISSFDTDSIITSMDADYYEFVISNAPEIKNNKDNKQDSPNGNLPSGLEPLE